MGGSGWGYIVEATLFKIKLVVFEAGLWVHRSLLYCFCFLICLPLCNLEKVFLVQIQENPTLLHNLFSIICKWLGKSQRSLRHIPNNLEGITML